MISIGRKLVVCVFCLLYGLLGYPYPKYVIQQGGLPVLGCQIQDKHLPVSLLVDLVIEKRSGYKRREAVKREEKRLKEKRTSYKIREAVIREDNRL